MSVHVILGVFYLDRKTIISKYWIQVKARHVERKGLGVKCADVCNFKKKKKDNG